MVVGKVEQGSGMASVENSLNNTMGIRKRTQDQRATHQESAPNWKRINEDFFELLKTCQWIQAVEMD